MAGVRVPLPVDSLILLLSMRHTPDKVVGKSSTNPERIISCSIDSWICTKLYQTLPISISVGYDVFMFDYRLSMELPHAIPSSRPGSTMDVVANLDWPAAVGKVLEICGTEQVDVIAHCVGSTTFLMSMLAGHLNGQIRYFVLSSSFLI